MLDFEMIADSTLDLEIWMDLQGQAHWVNPLVADSLGYQREMLLHQPDFPRNLLVASFKQRFAKILEQVKSGQTVNDIDIELQHCSGKHLPAALSAKVILQNQAPIAIRMSIRLIAEPSRLDSAIRQVFHYQASAGLESPLFNLCQALFYVAECDNLALFDKAGNEYQLRYATKALQAPLTAEEHRVLNTASEQIFYLATNNESFKKQPILNYQADSLIAVALPDTGQQISAILVAVFAKPLPQPLLTKTLFHFFTPQLTAELKRHYAEQYILKLNTELESIIAERTQELEQTLTHLKLTQQQLVHSEKMASLTLLVSGVAHKLNTPIANVLISSDHLREEITDIKLLSEQTKLSKQRFENFLEKSLDASRIILSNINKASSLVNSFKNLAFAASEERVDTISLFTLFNRVSTLLAVEFESLPHISWPQEATEIVVTTYPHLLTQVLLQIVTNAIHHAFDNIAQPQITVSACIQNQQWLELVIADNGVGIAPENLSKIFDPFFGKNLNTGTGGLGLYFCYNLVTGPLKGQICARAELNKGTEILLRLPITINYQ
ncbi:hypothetical protein GCM10010919_08360 [Alishewanella longhuensis]|uniref:histidine kinase n=1 Tax=Alishewanella longhuensis TaxID=1091037 RepID=A0ABQ3KZV7_9ALTE|nr:PAS domain-containing sensor histidine kinase [Alishewanella longhuensis]GHG63023.1 hypothetical protein GCM10010919_08360 [Alishewanella longhuensis]